MSEKTAVNSSPLWCVLHEMTCLVTLHHLKTEKVRDNNKDTTFTANLLYLTLSLHRVNVSNDGRKFAFVQLKVSKQSWVQQFHLMWRMTQNFTLFIWNPCEWTTASGPRPPFEPQQAAVRALSSHGGAHLTTLNPAAHCMQVSVSCARQYRPQKQNEGVHFWIPVEVEKKREKKTQEDSWEWNRFNTEKLNQVAFTFFSFLTSVSFASESVISVSRV